MKSRVLLTLPLVAGLMLPAVAQTQSTSNQAPAATASESSSQPSASSSTQAVNSDQSANSDQNMTAHQPLEPDMRQGFWGKMNPFARKKYVQRQLSPVRNRVNELDDLTAANTKSIKDVDARAQEGIRQASAQAATADQHATEAGTRAQQANQTALQASNRLNTVEQVVGNIDQYQPATQTEIRFRSGQTALGSKAKEALDNMTADLKDQKGYIVQVQGFSPSGVQNSQSMANSVVRYLVEKNQVPVYRIFVMGMGNAKLPATEAGNGKPAHGNRVEVSLLKNNVDQLGAANQSSGMGESSSRKDDYSAPANYQSSPTQPQSNSMSSTPATYPPQ